MHDDVVDGDADRAWKALVPERGRHAAVRADELVGDPVELESRHARLEPLADMGDRLGDEITRARDSLDLRAALADDHAAAPSTSSSASSISAATSPIVRSACSGTSLPVTR